MSKTMTRAKTASRRPARRRKRSAALPVIFGVAVVTLLFLALVLSAGNREVAGAQTAPVEVAGDALAVLTDGQADPAVGLPAPTLRGTDFEGSPVVIEPGGRPMIVLFAAHWCGYCQREVDELSPWLEDGSAAQLGVDLVAVSTGVDPKAPNYPPSAWFEREQWPDPVLLDNDRNAAAEAYGLPAYPFFVFIDADGAVVSRVTGNIGVEALETLAARLTR